MTHMAHLLRPGTRLRQMAVRGRSLSSVAWTPASLSGLAVTLLPALSRSQGKLWQDSGKTTPATADGDPVRVAVCPFTALEWTAPSDAARPLLWDEGGGKWSLAFDGVDDVIQTAGAALGANPVYLAARLVFAGTGVGGLARWTGNASDNNSYYVLAGTLYESFGTTTRRSFAPSLAVTAARTYDALGSGSAWQCWLDGVSQASFGTNALPTWNATVRLGGNTANFWAGRIAGLVTAAAAPGAAGQSAARNYIAPLM